MFDQSPIVSDEQDEKNPDSSKNIGIQPKNRTSPKPEGCPLAWSQYKDKCYWILQDKGSL